ncbi:MAG TPA: PEP-utilizing enzyme [Acidimicrobiales bacterium]|nr:PEP-utilizing enzyme [Acidimicrobiales bacterium]
MQADAVRWDRPGPGTWLLDASHSGPAPGPIVRRVLATTLERGLAEGLGLFGAPLKGMEVRWVNGRLFRRLVPIVGGSKDGPPPPAPILWLASRVHPAFRKQERLAKESFAVKRWRLELARWESDWKPNLIARNRALSDLDLSSFDDDALARHIDDAHEHVLTTAQLHHRLHVSDMGPLGNLMVALRGWGLDPAQSFEALVAASPATRAPAIALRLLAQELVDAGVGVTSVRTLDEVRAASPRAASLLDDYLAHHGWRLTTGYDLEDSCLIELPEVIVTSIRAAADGSSLDDPEARAEEALAALRSSIPAEHLAEFEELVEDARLSYGLRDENGPLTYEWPAGLLRRALLEAGRRLAASGALLAGGEVFELEIEEIDAMLRGGGEAGPGADEIARRRDERATWATLSPPERLGPEEGDPPFHLFPPNLAHITDVVLTVVASMEASAAHAPLTGTGVGTGTYRGTARVVHDVNEALGNLEPGDVLVAPYTAPTYNAVLAIAGALVVEEGGLLCHAAVIAREFGIPAVVGAREAMQRIPDGATVEVDPARGTVAVLDR